MNLSLNQELKQEGNYVKNKTKMKILNSNGRVANKKVHFLADTIMEASFSIVWSLNDEVKKEFLLSSLLYDNDNTITMLNNISDEKINHYLACDFAFRTWCSGFYGDYKVDSGSILDYFFEWI